ncbi:MAG: TIGR02679 domain-containing protein [Clostridia bacterium]
MGRTIEGKNIKFRMMEFEQALNETKYCGVSMRQLLEGYFKENLITNKHEKEKISEDRRQFFKTVRARLVEGQKYSEPIIGWLDNISDTKSSGHNLIIAEYEKDRHKVLEMIMNVCKAVNYLKEHQGDQIRLAVLSALITTKPHYFDRSNVEGRLLLYALSSLNNCEYPNDAEKTLELYYISGIQPDGISSHTAAYGISLYTERGIHEAYERFIEEKEEYLITLSNLNRVVKAEGIRKKVFVVENQMVFSQLCECMKMKDVSLMCTSGQLKKIRKGTKC